MDLNNPDTLLALRELINARLRGAPSSAIADTSAAAASAAGPSNGGAASPTSSEVADTSAAAASEEVVYQTSSVRDE